MNSYSILNLRYNNRDLAVAVCITTLLTSSSIFSGLKNTSQTNKGISLTALTNILLQRGDIIQLAAAQSKGGQQKGGRSDSIEPPSPFKGGGEDQKSKTPSSEDQSSIGSAAKSAAASARSHSDLSENMFHTKDIKAAIKSSGI
jgi:hypothetical protein